MYKLCGINCDFSDVTACREGRSYSFSCKCIACLEKTRIVFQRPIFDIADPDRRILQNSTFRILRRNGLRCVKQMLYGTGISLEQGPRDCGKAQGLQ